MKLLISILGVVLVLEGLPYATFPVPMQRWLKQMVSMPPRLLQFFGILAICAGLFLCFIAQKTPIFG